MTKKLSSQRLPWPTRWTELFGSERPLILEIGFGYGQYLLHLAVQNPDAHIIGVEINSKCLATVEERIEKRGLTNVRVIHSRAETALHHLFEPATISEIHVNFPDPWFKKKHGHRRLIQRDTLDAIVSRMRPGARFFLATDIAPYAEMSAKLLVTTPGLENLLNSPWTTEPLPERMMTRYEAKARRLGETCHYFAYRRNTCPAPDVPVRQELTMPHIVFESPLTLEDFAAQFVPEQKSIGETHINFMAVYRSEKVLLYEVYVNEPTIDQHFAFTLHQREESGDFSLNLNSLGHPRPTAGVHIAAELLSRHLLRLHPQNKVTKDKIRHQPEVN